MKGRRTAFRRVTLVTATAVAGAFGGVALSGVPAHAAPASTLVASPNDLTGVNGLDFVNSPTSAQVSVSLDLAGCLNVFNKGQTYTIGAVSGDTTVATVSPAGSTALHCGDSAIFMVTAACPGGTANITFTPVAGPPGIQKKLARTSVPVQVTNATTATCTVTPPPPPGGSNPAAPAVANLYLDNNPVVPNTSGNTVAGTCKSLLGGAKNWRGQVVSAVAHWMPTPESLKDTYFSDPNDWLLYVETEVNALCGVSNGGFLTSGGTGSQSGTSFGSPLVPYSGPLGP